LFFQAAAAVDDDDDDDVDLFGEETEEEKKAAEERAAAVKASGKKKECKFHICHLPVIFKLYSALSPDYSSTWFGVDFLLIPFFSWEIICSVGCETMGR